MPEYRTLRTDDVTEISSAALRGAATDPDLWKQWLTVIANHPKESANNCASIMSSVYDDTRELRTAEEWADLGGEIKEGAQYIPLVHRSKSGNFFVDLAYPAAAVEAREDMKEQFENRYRGLAKKIDLEDQIDGPAYINACKKYSDDLAEIDPNVAFIIETRYGIEPSNEPELPALGITEDPKSLAQYCRSIKRDAENLIFKLDRTIHSQRYHLANPKVEVAEKPVEKAAQTESVSETKAEQKTAAAEAPKMNEAAQAAYSAPSMDRPINNKQSFDASAHINSPSDIYSAAAVAAKSASSDQASQNLSHTQ